MQQSISIETLGDLVAHDHYLSAMCERCRHRTDLDMQALIAKLGADFGYIGRTLDRRLVCSRCGREDRQRAGPLPAFGSVTVRRLMARSARNVNPSLSSDPRDKLLAALNWPYGQWKRSAEYQRAPMYFDACLEWYRALSDDDHETVLTLADVVAALTRAPLRAWRPACRRRRGVRCDRRPRHMGRYAAAAWGPVRLTMRKPRQGMVCSAAP